MANADMCLEAARKAFPDNEELRVAYMLGFNEGYDRATDQPSLPSNLDEAAEKVEAYYDVGEEHGYLYCHTGDIKDAFKAGAEWMAGQGVSSDSEACKLAGRAWVAPKNEKQFMQDVYDNFAAGDKVIVQIRKKEV